MLRPIIYPYKMASSSAKRLAQELGALRVFPDGKYRPREDHLIVTWGNTQVPRWLTVGSQFLNHPVWVTSASNKLDALKILSDSNVLTPEWTEDRELAQTWAGEGNTVLCRSILTGHSGQGIIIADSPIEVIDAPLYTKYKKKKKELRVHVFRHPENGLEVIDVQEKRKDRDYQGERNHQVRVHQHGWVYCREDIQEPEGLRTLAIASVEALGLDFGAVDIIWNQRENQCYTLEVNTAPGLEGATIISYANAIRTWLQ